MMLLIWGSEPQLRQNSVEAAEAKEIQGIRTNVTKNPSVKEDSANGGILNSNPHTRLWA